MYCRHIRYIDYKTYSCTKVNMTYNRQAYKSENKIGIHVTKLTIKRPATSRNFDVRVSGSLHERKVRIKTTAKGKLQTLHKPSSYHSRISRVTQEFGKSLVGHVDLLNRNT